MTPDTPPAGPHTVEATLVGGPTLLLVYAGLRVLTDPTFDPPGVHRDDRPGAVSLTKTAGPALPATDVLPVDLVLLSHDQHPDNLDTSGRAVLAGVVARGGTVLSTPTAAGRVAGVTALEPWASTVVRRPDGSGAAVTVTAVPALHGPQGAEAVAGPVTGFVLESRDRPTVYVSGDNADVGIVGSVADRFPGISLAVLFCGGADVGRFPGRTMTFRGADAAEAAALLADATVVPVHADSWAHFTESVVQVVAAFEAAGIAGRLRVLEPGVPTEVTTPVTGG